MRRHPHDRYRNADPDYLPDFPRQVRNRGNTGRVAQRQAQGTPIVWQGVITYGGRRSDEPGKPGVFLRHHRPDFSETQSATRQIPHRRG
jgi:hypothetical protein